MNPIASNILMFITAGTCVLAIYLVLVLFAVKPALNIWNALTPKKRYYSDEEPLTYNKLCIVVLCINSIATTVAWSMYFNQIYLISAVFMLVCIFSTFIFTISSIFVTIKHVLPLICNSVKSFHETNKNNKGYK